MSLSRRRNRRRSNADASQESVVITIMTRRISTRPQKLYAHCRGLLRTLWYGLRRKRPPKAAYGGHPGVTRSLVEGLRKSQLPFVLEPTNVEQVTDICVVLSGLSALKQAIEWKRKGRIKKLIAGPNLFVLPSDAAELISSPMIDVILANSRWTQDVYVRDLPVLQGRCEIWPAGVDEKYWAAGAPRGRDIQVYVKSGENGALVERACETLTSLGRRVVILNYGGHKQSEYRAALTQAQYAIFFSRYESQGLALAEAWSMDVPTLVWEGGPFVFRGGTPRAIIANTSSAPYLSQDCGVSFQTEQELVNLIYRCESAGFLSQFFPRRRVSAELTDEVCARHLWGLAHGHLSPPPALGGDK